MYPLLLFVKVHGIFIKQMNFQYPGMVFTHTTIHSVALENNQNTAHLSHWVTQSRRPTIFQGSAMSIKCKLINGFILLKEIKVELTKFYDYIHQKKVKTTFPSSSPKHFFPAT